MNRGTGTNTMDLVYNYYKNEEVETPYGKVHCAAMGAISDNKVILTYHDVGLNHKTCFDPLFSHGDMAEITDHFAVIHVNAPGQQEGADNLPIGYTYPSILQLSKTLPLILKHFGLRSVIGLGVGAGASILTSFALNNPDQVEALVLINIRADAEGLLDTVTQKVTGMTKKLSTVIISHLFGRAEIQANQELIATYRKYITTSVNQSNLGQFWSVYNDRPALEIKRPVKGSNTQEKSLLCPTLLVVGDNSPAVEAVVEVNFRLNPIKTTLLKMADCGGLPQVEQPASLAEAIKYLIQGLGYMSSAGMTRLMRCQTASSSGDPTEPTRALDKVA